MNQNCFIIFRLTIPIKTPKKNIIIPLYKYHMHASLVLVTEVSRVPDYVHAIHAYI